MNKRVGAGGSNERGPAKIIFAGRAETPPVIDGVLDEQCWNQAELRDDFTDPFFGRDVSRRTAIRFLYDDENLYMGLQCEWSDGDAFARQLARIEKEYGPVERGIAPSWERFANYCSVELFLDPGASLANYYQIMLNAAGQIFGNYKAIESIGFSLKPRFEAIITDGGWRAELALRIKDIPGASLKPGDEWGLNVCRNDEAPYSLWKLVGERYREPKAFGRLIIGDYEEWWSTVRADGRPQALAEMRKELEPCAADAPWVMDLYEHLLRHGRSFQQTAAEHPPTSRENIEVLYCDYRGFRRILDRLDHALRTHKRMREARKQ